MDTEITQTTAWCYGCGADQPVEVIDSEAESCAAFVNLETMRQYRPGVHMRGYRCLVCGDIETEPCIHD